MLLYAFFGAIMANAFTAMFIAGWLMLKRDDRDPAGYALFFLVLLIVGATGCAIQKDPLATILPQIQQER